MLHERGCEWTDDYVNLGRRLFGVPYPPAKEVNTQKITSQSLWETDKAVFVELLVPGVPKKDISIEVVDDTLTISHHNQEDVEENAEVRGYRHESFEYSWRLCDNHDQQGITASSSHGILTVRVPKIVPPEPETKTVKIQ